MSNLPDHRGDHLPDARRLLAGMQRELDLIRRQLGHSRLETVFETTATSTEAISSGVQTAAWVPLYECQLVGMNVTYSEGAEALTGAYSDVSWAIQRNGVTVAATTVTGTTTYITFDPVSFSAGLDRFTVVAVAPVGAFVVPGVCVSAYFQLSESGAQPSAVALGGRLVFPISAGATWALTFTTNGPVSIETVDSWTADVDLPQPQSIVLNSTFPTTGYFTPQVGVFLSPGSGLAGAFDSWINLRGVSTDLGIDAMNGAVTGYWAPSTFLDTTIPAGIQAGGVVSVYPEPGDYPWETTVVFTFAGAHANVTVVFT